MSIKRIIAPKAILVIAVLSLAVALLCCAQSGLFDPVTQGCPTSSASSAPGTDVPCTNPSASVACPPDTLISESRLYSISRRATYTNTGSGNVSGDLQMSVIPSLDERQSHCQSVVTQQFTPEPSRYESDFQGNKWAVFHASSLQPGQTFTVHQTAQVRIANLTRAIDASTWPATPAPTGVATNTSTKAQNATPTEVSTKATPASPSAPASASRTPGTVPNNQPALQRWVNAAVGTERHPWLRLVRLYDSVRALDYRLNEQPRSLEQVLATRQAQCLDAATLMTALLAQEGWPARVVNGLYLRPEDPRSCVYHAWSEARLPVLGWVPFDPTMGRFPEARSSRLAQLDCYYLILWLGEHPQTMASWQGPQGELGCAFEHTLLKLDAHSVPGSSLTQAAQRYAQALAATKSHRHSNAQSQQAENALEERHQGAQNEIDCDEQAHNNPKPSAEARQEAERNESEPDEQASQVPGRNEQTPNEQESQTPGRDETTRLQETQDFYAQTKQLVPLWRTLTEELGHGVTLDNILTALSLAAESGDWDSLHLLSQTALDICGDEESLLGARALACFHVQDQEGLQDAMKRLHQLTGDGYSQLMWGTMCLDVYRYQEALDHWQQALQAGLPDQEQQQCQEQIQTVRKLLGGGEAKER